MDKLYERVNWENGEDGGTPLNKECLNKMDKGLDDLDNRVIEVDAKAPFVVNEDNELCMEVEES